MEVALSLVAEADAVLARLLFGLCWLLSDDVDLLVNLIVLFEDVLLRSVETGLKSLQHRDHELRVLSVLPSIDVSLEILPLPTMHNLLLHPEVHLEQVNKIGEQEALVNVCLDVIGQLTHEALVRLRLDGVVLVISPVVLEVTLKLLGHLLGQRGSSVEMRQ